MVWNETWFNNHEYKLAISNTSFSYSNVNLKVKMLK